MFLFLSNLGHCITKRAKPLGFCVAYNLFSIALLTSICSRWVKDWRHRPFSSKLEIVMLNALNVFLLTCWVGFPYNAYGRWDLLAYPFSPVLSGPFYRLLQDLSVSFYVIDTVLILTKIRPAALATYVHHFLMIICWITVQVYPEHSFHFMENVVFLFYESTNIPLTFVYLLREFNLRETKIYYYSQIVFALSYFFMRIIVVTIAWLHALRIWYLFPKRGPSSIPSYAMLTFLGMYYILIAYWGVLLARKMASKLKSDGRSCDAQSENIKRQIRLKNE